MNDFIETQGEVRQLAQALLRRGSAPLTPRERRMIERIARRAQVHDLNDELEERLTFGERLAERVTAFGGSWRFIAGFGVLLGLWALVNAAVLAEHAFDPYPFVFLNLVLSMLAAFQAPLILMSQNRQAARDRAAAELDYDTNLRSETHILTVLEKVDALQARLDALAAEHESPKRAEHLHADAA
ncbi:DUF1003 domain-containing protein [Roseomonas sp. E05]|uniref:DUF1003 domain-containing protein n=1 Tax=Roseomonas sp. E05 TaxID=3046310 RepID=UPI0024BBA630|nr:DUF1003 domain-containing protein [Roseomonas sp. E05]MDJ0389400.1 DUF1003 domain-containing protein [Roseomonas sp. E05]